MKFSEFIFEGAEVIGVHLRRKVLYTNNAIIHRGRSNGKLGASDPIDKSSDDVFKHNKTPGGICRALEELYGDKLNPSDGAHPELMDAEYSVCFDMNAMFKKMVGIYKNYVRLIHVDMRGNIKKDVKYDYRSNEELAKVLATIFSSIKPSRAGYSQCGLYTSRC